MANGYTLKSASKKPNNDIQFSNFNVDSNQIDCIGITYDGKRFKWFSNWEMLTNFIEHNLDLKGSWTSPGGSSLKFICYNLDL